MAAERLGELESSNKLVHRLNAAVQEAQQRAATDEQVRANPHFGGMQLLAEHARSSVSTVERLQREAQHASAFRTSIPDSALITDLPPSSSSFASKALRSAWLRQTENVEPVTSVQCSSHCPQDIRRLKSLVTTCFRESATEHHIHEITTQW